MLKSIHLYFLLVVNLNILFNILMVIYMYCFMDKNHKQFLYIHILYLEIMVQKHYNYIYSYLELAIMINLDLFIIFVHKYNPFNFMLKHQYTCLFPQNNMDIFKKPAIQNLILLKNFLYNFHL